MGKKTGKSGPDPTSLEDKRDDYTSEQISTMSGLGLPVQMIARIVKMSPTTLYKIYGEDLMDGKAAASLQVAKRMFLLATDDSVPEAVQFQALRYWTSTQMGWKENIGVQVSGEVTHKQVHIHFLDPHGKTPQIDYRGAQEARSLGPCEDESGPSQKLDKVSSLSSQATFI